jgi:hypothetical protein
MKLLKKYFLLLKQDFLLFALLSLPGVIFYFVGLWQLEAFSFSTLTIGLLTKFCVEFLTVSIIFYIVHILGFKKRGVFALVFFLYYITITADIVLLMYFKERFGLKYIMTLGGAQYQFMLDIRLLCYFVIIYFFPFFIVGKFWHAASRHISAKKMAFCAVLLLVVSIISPIFYLKSSSAFFATQLMDTTLAGIFKETINKKSAPQILGLDNAEIALAAQNYNLFTPTDFVNKKTYKRIILITTEALSNKFSHLVNPSVPPSASAVIDGLKQNYPNVSLKPTTLSTLYGLSVIFSGHANSELMFENEYPLSFVKILKENGFKTAFIRGANEHYMNEDVLFKQAGFSEVYGADYFSKTPYADKIAWWGLMDRSLFDFTINYLKENRDQKVFIDILNVDTHVPSGRTDYLGQTYPPLNLEGIDPKIARTYDRPNMARAFRNYDYELGLFIENLEKKNLLDDDTLLIITADHPFYANLDIGPLVKNYQKNFEEVPFILITKNKIEETLTSDKNASQQDIGPTILGLAGFKTPINMMGRSLFENTPERSVFELKNNYVIVQSKGQKQIISKNAKEPNQKALITLLTSIVK